jgi:hypothetical protein
VTTRFDRRVSTVGRVHPHVEIQKFKMREMAIAELGHERAAARPTA